MSRLFDPIELMNTPVVANATRRDPRPVGEAIAQIVKMDIKDGISRKPGKPETPWARLDLTLEVADPDYLALIPGNPEKVTMNLGVMLDMNGGQIATGPNKNVRLGQLREACGVNGQPLGALNGQMLRISVIQKPHYKDDGNPDGEFYGVVQDEVAAFAKA
jgi:hypothetical protein